ncbi:MAG: CHAT domain-containing protein, partial [FCB group bacterium]|nr:CHAT domain-containing protein [FCB group bacterium]
DDIFSQIPFMALLNQQDEYLFHKYKIKIIVNPEELIRRKNKQFNFHKRVNSIFAVSSDMLPAIELEAERIDNFYPESLLYTQEEANLKNLTNAFKKTNGFLHIAAHASRSSENPLFSRIMMSDAPFFPFDLFGHGLKTKLVTLSGCQTAAPGLYYGNSFSLAKAFYQAGK